MSIFQNMGQRAAGGVRDWFNPGEMTYEEMLRRRQIAQAAQTRQRDLSAPGAGFGALADAFVGKIAGGQADAATTKGREGASSALGALLQGRVGGGGMSAPQMNLLPPQQATSGGQMQPQIAPDGSIDRFPQSLIKSESGGNWQALNNEGYGGRLQFGADRLADAARAGVIPQGMTGAAFSRLPPEQQQAVEQWHFADIDRQAQRMGLDRFVGQEVAGIPITQDGIRAMAHLGGIGGAKKFLESGGRHNPADSNGTSLAKYAAMHGGGAGAMSFAAGGEPNVQFTSQMGGSEGIDPRLAELMQNPYVAELPQAQQSALGALFQKQLGQAYPEQMTPYQQAQVGLQREQFDWQRQQAMQPQPGYQVVTGEQAAQMGLDPSQAYNLGPDGKVTQVGGGGTNVNVNMGDGAPGLGKLSTDYGYVLDPQTREPVIDPATGLPQAAPVPGSAAARALEADQTARSGMETMTERQLNPTIDDIETARGLAENGIATTGQLSGFVKYIPGLGQDAVDMDGTIAAIGSGISLENLNQMRQNSPTGGALGNVSDKQSALLAEAFGSLRQSTSKELFLYNLARIENSLNDIVHGEGNGPERHNMAELGRTYLGRETQLAPSGAAPPPPESVMPPAAVQGAPDFSTMSDEELQQWLAQNG